VPQIIATIEFANEEHRIPIINELIAALDKLETADAIDSEIVNFDELSAAALDEFFAREELAVPFLTPQEKNALEFLLDLARDKQDSLHNDIVNLGDDKLQQRPLLERLFQQREIHITVVRNMVHEFGYLSTYARRPEVDTR
jgi:hypothetical protein